MVDALNRQIVAEVKDFFKLGDVYLVLHEAEEYMNIAKRKTQVDLANKEVKVPDQPIGFVKLVEVGYDESRNGFKGKRTGYSFVSEWQKYVAVKLFTVKCGYEVVLYSVLGKQGSDLVSYWLYFPRETEILARLGDQLTLRLPVSMVVEEVGVPEVDFTLRDRGIKLYKVSGRLNCLTFLIPENVEKSQVSGWDLAMWGTDYSNILYEPLKRIRLKFKVGYSVFGEDGVELDEVLPCILQV